MAFGTDTTKKVQCAECDYVWFPFRNGLVRNHKKIDPNQPGPYKACSGVGKRGKEPPPKPQAKSDTFTPRTTPLSPPSQSLVAAAVEARRKEEMSRKGDLPSGTVSGEGKSRMATLLDDSLGKDPNKDARFCSFEKCPTPKEPLRSDNTRGVHHACWKAGAKIVLPPGKAGDKMGRKLEKLFAPLKRQRTNLQATVDALEKKISELHQTAEGFRAAISRIDSVVEG